jgi:indolepyruvate ferredoxin oxidoreductase
VDDESIRLLAKMKFLRGTAIDPFGRTEERRTERTCGIS